jgi:hypothetical protein
VQSFQRKATVLKRNQTSIGDCFRASLLLEREQHWEGNRVRVCLSPFLAKAYLLWQQSFSKSFDRISHRQRLICPGQQMNDSRTRAPIAIKFAIRVS